MDTCFYFSWVNTEEWVGRVTWSVYLQLSKKLPDSFWKWLYHFTFLPVLYGHSSCSTFSPAFGTVSLLNVKHPNACVKNLVMCFSVSLAILLFLISKFNVVELEKCSV